MTLREFTCPPQKVPFNNEMLHKLEDSLQQFWKHLNMEVELGPPHGHFLERLNDARNGQQISFCEVQKLFVEVFRKYGKMISQKHPNFEAVMTDLQSNVNIPFMLKLDSRTKQLEIVAKTAMRKRDFKTNGDPKLAVEHKIFSFVEWLRNAQIY